MCLKKKRNGKKKEQKPRSPGIREMGETTERSTDISFYPFSHIYLNYIVRVICGLYYYYYYDYFCYFDRENEEKWL